MIFRLCCLLCLAIHALKGMYASEDGISLLYPAFPENQKARRAISPPIAPQRDYSYYSDITGLAEEMVAQYGMWQIYECRELKDELLEIEGNDRVRLAGFYNASLFESNQQVCSLRNTFGNWVKLTIRIQRIWLLPSYYVNGPSNYVAGSSVYSMGSINECENVCVRCEKFLNLLRSTVTTANVIASFEDEDSLESFCADLFTDSRYTCSCETKEEENKEAIIICTVPVLEVFIEAEEERDRKLHVRIEPDVQQKALPVVDVQEHHYTAEIQEAVKKGSTSIWGIDRIDDVSHKDGTYSTYPGSKEGDGLMSMMPTHLDMAVLP